MKETVPSEKDILPIFKFRETLCPSAECMRANANICYTSGLARSLVPGSISAVLAILAQSTVTL